MQTHQFGTEKSPLREDPVFRRYMEEYLILSKRVDEMEDRGYLSYDDMIRLKKMKKLKLLAKDSMEKRKRDLNCQE